MKGYSVLVTGATSGIGRACALAFLRAGWTVAGVGRDRARLAELLAEVGGTGGAGGAGQIVAIHADLTGPESARHTVDEAVARLGSLRCLVNAAGVLSPGGAEATTDEAFDRVMDTNVRALFRLTREAIPHLRSAGPGASVVNVSSVAGLRPYSGLLAYCASKAAVDAITRCTALDLAPHGIRVNAVNPGVVVTELHRRGGMDAAAYAAFLDRARSTHPLGRVGSAEEVAELVLFLASERAGWITGETLAIDGGRHLTSLR